MGDVRFESSELEAGGTVGRIRIGRAESKLLVQLQRKNLTQLIDHARRLRMLSPKSGLFASQHVESCAEGAEESAHSAHSDSVLSEKGSCAEPSSAKYFHK